MTLVSIPNPDLDVSPVDNNVHWNLANYRRQGFHNLHTIARYVTSIRSQRVLPFRKDIDCTIGERPDVARFLSVPHFSGFVVARDDRVLYEAYAADFGPDRPHATMSITKTLLNIMLGRCVAEGLLDLDRQVKDYLPEIGTGYGEATVRAVADMNVANNYSDDDNDPTATTTWSSLEAAGGLRSPPDDGKGLTIRSLLCGITGDDLVNRTGHLIYKTANSELLGWIVERVSKRSLGSWLIDIVDAAAFEHSFHIACDCDGVPLLGGGASLSARDLARFGLLFARRGAGVDGRHVADAAFIEETRRDPGPPWPKPREGLYYSRQTTTNGTWLGHGGYGGQYLLANPDTGIAVVYMAIFENQSGDSADMWPPLINMMAELAAAGSPSTGTGSEVIGT
ncbi:MAG: class A beta-lactamase-related serine hydrolase [Mesorhizobium sp.]|uniref:serine hydrolase domain-containing protein n=1 Tax=Mesorhizobium sp. TaxID=1871066 RepID=UPI000FE653CD|nr:serine hydrolase domain-containing protein [Mesorhizobium sp.]RWC27072.1 MAG: class A beta-lactamase-related serine hydrolase [Mesorhizobium sp.]